MKFYAFLLCIQVNVNRVRSNAGTHHNEGYEHHMNNKPSLARKHCEKALEIDPNYHCSHHNLANLLAHELGEYQEARSHYSKSFEHKFGSFFSIFLSFLIVAEVWFCNILLKPIISVSILSCWVILEQPHRARLASCKFALFFMVFNLWLFNQLPLLNACAFLSFFAALSYFLEPSLINQWLHYQILMHTATMPNNGEICAICLEEEGIFCELRCGHLFHPKCITAWLRISKKIPQCPICSQPIHSARNVHAHDN